MNIGIVGANGDIGMELSFLIRDENINVIPIVRTELAAAFFKYHGFSCEIFDSSSQSPTNQRMSDLDAVVIAARASNSNIQERRKLNERIIRNTVRNCGDDTSIIYLSSLAAYGRDFYGEMMDELTVRNYIEEKRYCEKFVRNEVKKNDSKAYILRLGVVVGPNQSLSKTIAEHGIYWDEMQFQFEWGHDSNALHTVTLCEAIERCSRELVEPGTYSLVNHPQWSWREVIEHYTPRETELTFHQPKESNSSGSALTPLLEAGWSFLRWLGQDLIYPVRIRAPYVVETYAVAKGKRENAASDIRELDERRKNTIDMPEFRYDSIGEATFPGLSKTRSIIEQEEIVNELFRNED